MTLDFNVEIDRSLDMKSSSTAHLQIVQRVQSGPLGSISGALPTELRVFTLSVFAARLMQSPPPRTQCQPIILDSISSVKPAGTRVSIALSTEQMPCDH